LFSFLLGILIICARKSLSSDLDLGVSPLDVDLVDRFALNLFCLLLSLALVFLSPLGVDQTHLMSLSLSLFHWCVVVNPIYLEE
jgi:hypothetical protein